jgi:hypothetical protein
MSNVFIPRFLESAFSKDFSFTDDASKTYDLYVHEMGNLKITAGKIIACDPLMYNDEIPFETTFPIGAFPVQLAIAKIKKDERVAFARINFAPDATPVTWELAIIPGQDVSELKKGEIFGYPVDAGTGCFIDTAAGKLFEDFENDDVDSLGEEMEKSYKNTWSYLLKELKGHTIALFSSGWGDGFYATYIGKDAARNICRIVTDFGVVFEKD